MSKKKILVITEVKHIKGLTNALNQIGKVTYLDNPNFNQVKKIINNYDAIFTNPNKSKIFIGKKLLENSKLKVVCTASTGTNTTQIATTAFVKNEIDALKALLYAYDQS